MSFTIYTVSDPASLGAALNGMALFFGQDDWVSSIIKTGLIISLLFILGQGVLYKGAIRLDVMLLQFIIVWAAFLPRTTVVVEQFENNAPPRVVDGVPYILAIPASIAGSFSLYMTNKIESAMSSVDSNYMSVMGSEHPFNPAKVLLSFAKLGNDPDPMLVETLKNAMRYCSSQDGLANLKLSTASDILKHIVTSIPASNDTNQTVIYSDTNPTGIPAICLDAKTYLEARSDQIYAGDYGKFGDKLLNIANLNSTNRYRANDQALTSARMTDPAEAITLVSTVSDNMQNVSAAALFNINLYQSANQLITNAGAPIDQAIELKTMKDLLDMADDESRSANVAFKIAPAYMDILFFIFVAALPLVLFVVIANPQSGVKTAGSYIMFGIWTQSWIPMMAIIMFWYQNQIQSFTPPATGLPASSVLYMSEFMKHLLQSTVAASDMIQKAPMITFAILAGSMFALSNLISSVGKNADSGAKGIDDKASDQMAKEAQKTGIGRMGTLKMGAQVAGSSGLETGAMRGVEGNIATGDTMSFGSGIGATINAGLEKVRQSAAQITKGLEKAITELYGVTTTGGDNNSASFNMQGSGKNDGSKTIDTGNAKQQQDGSSRIVKVDGATDKSSTGSVGANVAMDVGNAIAAVADILPMGKMAKAKKLAQQIKADKNDKEAVAQAMALAYSDPNAAAAFDQELAKAGAARNESVFSAKLSAGLDGKLTDANKLSNSGALSTAETNTDSSGDKTSFTVGQGFTSGNTVNYGQLYSQLGQQARQAANAIKQAEALTETASTALKSGDQTSFDTKAGNTTNIDKADMSMRYADSMRAGGKASNHVPEAVNNLVAQASQFSDGAMMQRFRDLAQANAAEYKKNPTVGADQAAAAGAFDALKQMANDQSLTSGTRTQAYATLSAIAKTAGINTGYDAGQLKLMGDQLDADRKTTNAEVGELRTQVGKKVLNAMSNFDKDWNAIKGQSAELIAKGQSGIDANAEAARAYIAAADSFKAAVESGAVKVDTSNPQALSQAQAAFLENMKNNLSYFDGATMKINPNDPTISNGPLAAVARGFNGMTPEAAKEAMTNTMQKIASMTPQEFGDFMKANNINSSPSVTPAGTNPAVTPAGTNPAVTPAGTNPAVTPAGTTTTEIRTDTVTAGTSGGPVANGGILGGTQLPKLDDGKPAASSGTTVVTANAGETIGKGGQGTGQTGKQLTNKGKFVPKG